MYSFIILLTYFILFFVFVFSSSSGHTIFFFQAEDGIRDAQESRGLGDVYKRQNLEGYGVSADTLTVTLTSNPSVNAHVVFISEPQIAALMAAKMPHGRAHCVLDNSDLPILLKDLFSRALAPVSSKL
eukprot:TRINITY_DN25458_c0_g1_i2.p1 TRINITY_DN25458_c0_g1~~TRINITY_DN25458_c0_g1_i2.p1  ORF type:complete len:128 (+),score=30.47 TRINITY_DN25458_c0_g1_i2:54-437(+)